MKEAILPVVWSVVFAMVSIPLVSMGYLEGRLNIPGYERVVATMLNARTAVFRHGGSVITCVVLTDFDHQCSTYCMSQMEPFYRLNDPLPLLFLPSSGYCRTVQSGNIMALAGMVFFSASVVVGMVATVAMVVCCRHHSHGRLVVCRRHNSHGRLVFHDAAMSA